MQTVKPEAHTVLADGDRLIFGKKVGQDNNIVHPITVGVKLLYEPEAASEITPASKSSSESPQKLALKSPSGRYGLPHLSSESPSDSDNDSDSDSDVQEIVPPTPPSINRSQPSRQSHRVEPNRSQSFLLRTAFLRRLLPPIYSASFCDQPIDLDAQNEAAPFTSLKKRLGLSAPSKSDTKEVIDVDAPANVTAGPSIAPCVSGFSTLSSMLPLHQPVTSWPTFHMPSLSHFSGSQEYSNPFSSTTTVDLVAAAREESMELATPEPPQEIELSIQQSNVGLPEIASIAAPSPVLGAPSLSSSSPSGSPSFESAVSQLKRPQFPLGMPSHFENPFSNHSSLPDASFDMPRCTPAPVNANTERRISDLSDSLANIAVSLYILIRAASYFCFMLLSLSSRVPRTIELLSY